jgi:hypothetical protein
MKVLGFERDILTAVLCPKAVLMTVFTSWGDCIPYVSFVS